MQKSRSDETRCAITTLTGFRAGLHQCWTSWPDAAFELTDTVLCMPSPVASVPALSLEPAFRRSHGSLYKALARGAVDDEAMRELLVEHRPSGWPLVFAVDASTWPRCDAETSPNGGTTTRRPNTPPDSRSSPAGPISGSRNWTGRPTPGPHRWTHDVSRWAATPPP